MSVVTAPKLMTAEEFLALPDDGVERWLIGGELREKRDTDMTMRNKSHSITEARVARILGNWVETQPKPRGEVVCGEAGFLLRHDPGSITAGVDVAIISAAQADRRSPNPSLVEGPALMIAEINSPYDTTEEIAERVEEYLECGVPLVWVINPYSRTVIVHRPDDEALALDVRDELDGGTELPGFRCKVSELFR
ncbi:MAG: Uma2 family endonuclease [Gemmataceae bacterium]